MPLDLFSYSREAGLSFTIGRYLATIVLSSASVEVILNKDRRTKQAHLSRVGGWATLNNKNLEVAAGSGLPAHLLICDDENLGDPTAVRFVKRRNKVAHGDIADIFRNLTDYDPVAEQEALDQLTKADHFLVEWFNTAPDVQEGHISRRLWPSR